MFLSASFSQRCLLSLLLANLHSQVLIITNSDEGWVQYSAERFCPKLLPVIAKYRVVSARTRYEKFYPGQPLCWKAAAFAHEVNEIYESLNNNSSTKCSISKDDANSSCASMEGTDVSSNSSMSSLDSMEEDGGSGGVCSTENREIVSFGDSMEERTAVSIVSGQMDAVPKSVKLMGTPSLLQIIGQLDMLSNHMRFVCESSESLDLHITQEQADKCAQSYLKEHGIRYDETVVPNYVPRKGSPLLKRND